MPGPRKTILAVAFLALGVSAASTSSAEETCDALDLYGWAFWVDILEALNPGIKSFELQDPERQRFLDVYTCTERAELCPPDHVHVFHCAGNDMVLVAFEKYGCVTRAEELLIPDFTAIVQDELSC